MFDSLLSNNRMKDELTRAIMSDKPMHAYLFCGAKGSGKLTAARLLARELVGTNADKADRGTHPDIIIVEPEKDRKLITVDQIRTMRADAFVNPSEGIRKIYIINGAHLINESGQNALLTILEQPPSFAIFILLSESREKMLPTVVSRCAVFDMEYVSAQDGVGLLSKQLPGIPQEQLYTAMNAAQGNIGLAKSLAEGGDLESSKSECEKVMLAAAQKDEYTLAKLLLDLPKDKLAEFLSVLSMYIRDITVHRCTGNTDGLVFKESVLQNAGCFDKINLNTLYDSAYECEKAIELIAGNVSTPLVCAQLVIRLCGGK